MKKIRGLALKLALLILASVTVIFSCVFSYNYFYSRRIITHYIEENAKNIALATVNRIDTVIRALEKVPENLAYSMESFSYDTDGIMTLLRSIIERNQEIYGATIAFEPYAHNVNNERFAPYFYKNGDKIEFKVIPYDYFHWDWYQIPKELNRPVWTEPYFDEGAGEIVMATYSVPFYRTVSGQKKFMGIVTADISLSWLQEIVGSIKIAKTGYGFLISKNGTFVTHPDSKLVMNETIFSVSEARKDPRMRELGREMIKGRSGFTPFRDLMTGKKCWMVYEPLKTSGWTLGVLFPQDELMADISRLNRTVLFLSAIGFLLLLGIIVWIAGSITKPLRLLSRATEHIGSGNLDIEIPPIKSKDEVGKLADSFEYMKTSLKKYIEELKETTAAKERIESELNIAYDIQMGMLPKIFPPFPDQNEFDIYAVLHPARQVGGDLYNFFFMDDDHLCFTVGDVSGKGVPAALFMAIVISLLKTKAARGLSTKTILNDLNHDLSIDNPSAMFVTLFMGILNIRTGELEYSNGGHNPPYLIRVDGTLEPLETTHDLALGIVEDFSYHSKKLVLQKNDAIFLYTDGVTEAMDESEALFSEKRMVESLAKVKEKPAEEVIDGVLKEIRAFSKGVEQTDDITMMMLKFFEA